MADFLAEHGVPREKIFVAPVGAVAPEHPRAPRPAVKRLLYIGSDEAWQGLGVLLEAMRLVERDEPELRLSVVGVAPERLQRMAPPANVEALGWVDRDQIPALYRDHDLFVIPRPSTPLTDTVIPMKSVEALVHHIPILASRLGAIEEVTGDSAAWFVEPGHAPALAEGMRQLTHHPERMVAMGEAAAARAPRFTWSTVGTDIVTKLFGGA